MIITIHHNAQDVATDFFRIGTVMQGAFPKVADIGAEQMLASIRKHASGRPGPNIITGDYVASWRIEKMGVGARLVSTSAPQANRLEYGFSGMDSLGRMYHQPPFPHVLPAVTEVSPKVAAEANSLVSAVIRGGSRLGRWLRGRT